jgi:hypothetical protein
MSVGKVPGGKVGQTFESQGTSADPTVQMGLNAQQMMRFRATPNARVQFAIKGKAGKASLASSSAVCAEDGSVGVMVNGGSEAADFAVVCTNEGAEVGRIQIIIRAMLAGQVVSAGNTVPPSVAHEIKHMLDSGDLRGALQLLARHDSVTSKALERGLGNEIAAIADVVDLTRSSLT